MKNSLAIGEWLLTLININCNSCGCDLPDSDESNQQNGLISQCEFVSMNRLLSKWAWKKLKPKKLFPPRSGGNSFLGFKLNRAYLIIVLLVLLWYGVQGWIPLEGVRRCGGTAPTPPYLT